jgi:SAM-dependent methyltransferase
VREYDLIAGWYASERVDETGDGTGVPEVAALASSLAPGALVLDIGCGNGVPLTRAVLRAGHRVIGLDSSGEMLARFRRNCPDTPAVRGAVHACPFAAAAFEAAVAWGVLFHLDRDDQIKAIAHVGRVLKPGAPFLFTSGDVDGAVPKEDLMNGVAFRYWSFTKDAYRSILADHGLTLVGFHEDAGRNGYYLSTKRENGK